MISIETKEIIASLFGWKMLQADEYTTYRETGLPVDVSLIWIAELKEYKRRSLNIKRNVVVAVVKSQEWRKGVLLIPTVDQTQEEYIGFSTLTPIEIVDDPVENVIKNFDLTTPNYKPALYEQSTAYHFSVMGKAMDVELDISLAGWGDNENVDNLRKAIKKLIGQMLIQYNRDDMKRFFDQFKRY